MASTIKQISDALIARIASQVSELNTRTVKSFPGFGFGQVHNYPFVGVAYTGGPDDSHTSDNSICEQIIRFKLWVASDDFRDASYSLETSYSLLEDIRSALQGHQLGLSIEPIRILGVEPDQYMLGLGVYIYTMEVETWQVRQ